MKKGDKTSVVNWKTLIIVGITFIAVLILLVAFYLIGGSSTGFTLQQFIGILVAAALSGVVTLLLLFGQTDTLREQRKGEAQKDKDVKIYSNKIAAFSTFNKSVWQNDLDETDSVKTIEIIKRIRKEFFSKVILYLDSTEIEEIIKIVKRHGDQQLPVVLSSIVGVLNNNANKAFLDNSSRTTEDINYHQSCQTLWNEFSNWINSGDENPDEERSTGSKEEAISANQQNDTEKTFSLQPWHFCMWSVSQIDYLKKGNNELSLVEYGEEWRTNQVKQVKPDDIVFLFRGNWRYSGVYKALGWRVFYYDTDTEGRRIVTEETSMGIPKVLPDGNTLICDVVDKLKEHDIYESFRDDSSTSCANVVIDDLSFIPDGVKTPNTTYRKTISRYDRNYAIRLLYAFMDADSSCRARIEEKLPGFLKDNNL